MKELFFNIISQNINQINVDQFIELLLTSIKQNNLVFEQKIQRKLHIPQLLIERINANLETEFIFKITKEQLFEYFNFKYNRLEDLYFCQFDFSHKQQFNDFCEHFTNMENLTQQQQYMLNYIKIMLRTAKGLFTNFNKLINANIILLNKKIYTEQTIRHQLIHYLQTYEKYGLNKNIKINEQNLQQFNFFPQKIDNKLYIKILFNKREFSTTLDNLISNLNQLYQKCYKDKTYLDFIHQFISLCDQNKIFKSQLYQNWKILFDSNKEIYFFIYSRINKYLNNKILRCLTNLQ